MSSPGPSADPNTTWRGRRVIWKQPQTWQASLTEWLESYFRPGEAAKLAHLGPLDLCWDDSGWLAILALTLRSPLEAVEANLGDALSAGLFRAYHGCRPSDAGVYQRDGVLANNPERLADQARRLVAETPALAWLTPQLEQRIAQFDGRDRDVGLVYFGADDRLLIEEAGHYLLYGSEWIQALLGHAAQRALSERGVPTILELDIPFGQISRSSRIEFARCLLQEWTRLTVNRPDWSPRLDFGFALDGDQPGDWVVSHHHPPKVMDVHAGDIWRRSPATTCPACASG